MIERSDFEEIIDNFFTIHNVDPHTKIEINFWNSPKFISLIEVAEILAAIPDTFKKIEIARDLTGALYSTPEVFIKMLNKFADDAIKGNI